MEEKIVTISNICHEVVVTISDIYCISLSGLGVVVVRAKRRGQTTTMAALAEEEDQLRVGNGECGGGDADGGGGEEAEDGTSLSRDSGVEAVDPIEEQGLQCNTHFHAVFAI